MATPFQRGQGKWLLLVVLAISSLMFTGCEKGSLGTKDSAIEGYVVDAAKNTPVADVLIHCVQNDGTRKEASTGGDGHFLVSGIGMTDGSNVEFTISAEKFGYTPNYSSGDAAGNRVRVGFGNTITAPTISMTKGVQLTKGLLRGYPVDNITGSPLSNFRVTVAYTPPNAARYKVFESADDFKANGWSGLEGGSATVSITAENYTDWQSAPVGQAGGPGAGTGPVVAISGVPFDLGVIRMSPLTVSINGTLRNLPGYVMGTGGAAGGGGFSADTRIWAEAAGKVVATGTAQAIEGNAIYNIANVPITAGSVAVKCKIRGYDLVTINPAVTIPKQRPSGTIAAIDANFENIEPIKRDVRVVLVSAAPTTDNPKGSFYEGERGRVFVRQGGRDMVPYVDVTAVNFRAEAYISGVVTGYPLDFLTNNLARGWLTGTQAAITIPEDGGTVFTVQVAFQ